MENITLKIGSDDLAKVYVNGKGIFKSDKVRPADEDQDSAPVLALDKGVNTAVFKLVNWKYNWEGCLRFTDKDDKPITKFEMRLKSRRNRAGSLRPAVGEGAVQPPSVGRSAPPPAGE